MQSFLKEFRLPLEKEMHALPESQPQPHHERAYSSHCHSQQTKRRTIKDLLKQQIYHSRVFRSGLNSINNSPLRDNLCTSPIQSYNQQLFNKSFVQDNTSPSSTDKKKFLIVTDFNNKHYKIIQTNKNDTNAKKTAYNSLQDKNQGVLLSNLKLKQACIGNIQFPKKEDECQFSYDACQSRRENEMLRPTSMMSHQDRRRTLSQYNNSPPQSKKYKLNSTFRDSHSTYRQNQSINNDAFFASHIQFAANSASSQLNSSINQHQFPANMPVKTRKYRLRKEDVIDRAVNEQIRKECNEVKEKVRYPTQYTQNDSNSSYADCFYDSSYNIQTMNNHNNNYNNYNNNDGKDKGMMNSEIINYNALTCKGTRPYSHQSSPVTKRERHQKLMNRSALLSRENSNEVAAALDNRIQQKQMMPSYQVQSKVLENQIVLTPEKINLSNQRHQDAQNISTTEQKKVLIDTRGRLLHKTSNSIKQNDDVQQVPQNTSVIAEQRRHSSVNYNNEYPLNMKSMQDTVCESNEGEQLIKKQYQALPKQEIIKYKLYNQFHKQPQIQRLFTELDNQEQQKQELLKTVPQNNQYNYFAYNRIFA